MSDGPMNEFLVAAQGDGKGGWGIRIMALSPLVLSHEQALNLAAWLVTMAHEGGDFDEILRQVRST